MISVKLTNPSLLLSEDGQSIETQLGKPKLVYREKIKP